MLTNFEEYIICVIKFQLDMLPEEKRKSDDIAKMLSDAFKKYLEKEGD